MIGPATLRVVLTVLIGGPASGKSTVGGLVADSTSRPMIDADEHGTPWYAEVGWSVDRLHRRAQVVGFSEAHREWEVALAHVVQQLVAHHPHAVLALGAGHTHLTTPTLLDDVGQALSLADQVILLRPSADPGVSATVLRARCVQSRGSDWVVEGQDWLQRWLTDGHDDQLATHVVETGGESPQQTADRIVTTILA